MLLAIRVDIENIIIYIFGMDIYSPLPGQLGVYCNDNGCFHRIDNNININKMIPTAIKKNVLFNINVRRHVML